MDYQKYKAQVRLLLQVLPLVIDEKVFALHGGTAINLFYFDMPRLSVDIDLTYIPIEDRDTTFKHINASLITIKKNIERYVGPKLHLNDHENKTPLILLHNIKQNTPYFVTNDYLCIRLRT